MGIVASVAEFLVGQRCNIVDSAQFGDPAKQRFFMRVCFASDPGRSVRDLQDAFAGVGDRFEMQWTIHDTDVKPRVVLMVSRFGHCLNDLLYRYRIGALRIDIPAIISNHRDFYQLSAAHDIPFHHLPVSAATKAKQEQQVLEVLGDTHCDLVVLARYMQILSPALCTELSQRAINIHHSFLPSFQGAKPHQRAYERGVKLIGATAHYVTEDLDEGPIIEQDVARVDHSMSIDDLAGVGRDVECAVLARAVKWHVEHRILLNGNRTVVFR